MSIGTLLLAGAGVAVLGLFLYWQLVIAEGAYLGTRLVTLTYDWVAHRYDRIKQYNPADEAAFLGYPLVFALRHLPAPYLLDAGTGTARLPMALFEHPTFNGRVVALDSSRRMLKVAAEKVMPYRHRIDLLWQDAACLPFPDATFDAVACLEVLEFTPDPAAQLAELVRVLRPGGLLVTSRRRGIDAMLMPGKTHSKEQLAALLAALDMQRVRIQPWQADYDLVWAVRGGGDPLRRVGGMRPLVEVLRCPSCGEVAFAPAPQETGLVCGACGVRVATGAGVVELRRARRRAARSSRE